METIDPEVARWLVSAPGLDAVGHAVASLDVGVDELALGTTMRADGEPPARVTAVLGAAFARRRARQRWSDAERLLFTRSALEQASDPELAAWRARRVVLGPGAVDATPAAGSGQAERVAGPEVWDLAAGVGGDSIALGRAGAALTAVERDPARAVLLEHNLAVSGVDARVLVADALEVRIPPAARVHADPSRRRGERRVRHLDDHQPPVGALLARHAGTAGVAVTLAPGVDRDQPALGDGIEVEYVQLGDQLLEAVAWRGELRRAEVTASATLLPSGAHLERRGARGEQLPVAEPDGFLLEVAPAAVRARLHDRLGAELGARRLAARRALLSCPDAPPSSPWYRARPIAAVLPARPKAVRRWLAARHERPVELVLHGVDADLGRWWRELGRPPRGPAGWRLELVRRDTDALVVVTDAAVPGA